MTLRHQLQDAARPLKPVDRRPILVEAVEHFRVDGIGLHEAVVIAPFLRFGGKLRSLGNIRIGEGPADTFACPGVSHWLEEPSANNLKSFFGRNRLPERMYPPKSLFKRAQRGHSALATRLDLRLRQ